MELEERTSPFAFGALLRRHRLAAGLSQEALAERARMSSDGISSLERGHRRSPQRETLALLASALALHGDQRQEFEAAAVRPPIVGRTGSVRAGPWSDAGAARLPLALTSFVGREPELKEIATRVRNHRLVTITGAGGVGKTQTALQVAATMRRDDDAAVYFVGLAPQSNSSLIASTIASALGVQEVPNRLLIDTVIAYVKHKALLLILDNCEHVISEAANVVNRLLLNCPRLRIIATSREALRSAGERAYRLPSLNIAEAVDLFIDRARAVDAHFTLTEEHKPIIAELCERLDGIPLAIELAAARVNVLSLEALVDNLECRFALLSGGARTALPRQQTMRAAIEWSYELLSAREQRVFDRFSVFAGGCTLDSASVVCADQDGVDDDILDVLSALVDKSLVLADLDGSEVRYRFLDSFREYAHEKLVARGEAQVIAHRHALACLDLAQQLDLAYHSGRDEFWYARGWNDLANWQAALRWTLSDRGDIDLGQQIVVMLNAVWSYIGRLEGRRWIGLALELVNDRTPPSTLADLAYAQASVAWALREYEGQLKSGSEAALRYGAIGNSLGVARAQSLASHALFHLGRLGEARALAREAEEVSRRFGDLVLVVFTTRVLGVISALDGDIVCARRYIADALRICDSLGSSFNAAKALVDLSCCEFYVGDAQLMLRHAQNAFDKLSAFRDPNTSLWPLDLISASLILLARYDEAKRRSRELFELARGRNDAFAAFALEYLAIIAALRSEASPCGRRTASARAARILGFTGAHLAVLGSTSSINVRGTLDKALAALRDALGADVISFHITAGAGLSEEEAFVEALGLD